MPDSMTAFAERYAQAWSGGKPEAVAAFFAESAFLQVNNAQPAVGRAAITAVAQGFMEAFPNMAVSFDNLIVKPGGWMFHWTLTGRFTGPGGTGKRVCISGTEDWKVGPDGLIAESRGHFDAAEYIRQIEFGAD